MHDEVLVPRTNEGRANYRVGFIAALAIAERWLDEGRTFNEYVAWMQSTAALLASIEGNEEAPCHSVQPSNDEPYGRRHQP